MKIKEIHYGLKKGLPNFSSVTCEITAQVDEGENLDEAFDRLKQEVENYISQDPSWINRSGVN